MALKAIANTGMTLQIVEGSPTPVEGTITVVGPPSTKVKAGGSFVYQDNLSITVSAITSLSAGASIPDPATKSANIAADATKVKAEGTLVLRVDDLTAVINATPQIPNSPNPINYPVTFKVKIVDAGQTKATGE